jgi:EpsI family protein
MSKKRAHATNSKSSRRPVIMAAVVAALIMFTFGLGYRVLAARLAAPVNSAPIDPAALARLPLHIGEWTGEDVPLDEAIVRATDTDAHVNRRYLRRDGLEAVSLYIASGVKARDLMPHRPEVCYTGAGWTLMDQRFIKLPLPGGSKLPCNVLQFSRGTLNTQWVTVLDYYIVDGQYCHDVSLLRLKAWHGSGTVGYVAQVEIVAPVAPNLAPETAQRAVSDFAAASAPPISQVFESVRRDQKAGR